MSNAILELTLPKHVRLQTSAQFDRVFQNAEYRLSGPQFLILAKKNSLTHSRLGMVIGSKAVPQAVLRNRVKRIIRESFRHISLGSLDTIVLAKSTINGFSTPSIRETIDILFTELKSTSRKL